MWKSWLEIAGNEFAENVKAIIGDCTTSLNLGYVGGEDTQCQHLFTSIFRDLKAKQVQLSRLLIKDCSIPNLRVEVRFYRSKPTRNHKDQRMQFIESETGADFALSLMVNLENIAITQRHVIAQVKLIKDGVIRIKGDQLDLLEASAGGEQGLYAIWGDANSPIVITVANLKAVVRATTSKSLHATVIRRFGRVLSDYMVDDFLGLWHGVDFYSKDYGENPPMQSIPVLFHLLHGKVPPANVTYFGIFESSEPGFYAYGMDIPSENPIL